MPAVRRQPAPLVRHPRRHGGALLPPYTPHHRPHPVLLGHHQLANVEIETVATQQKDPFKELNKKK